MVKWWDRFWGAVWIVGSFWIAYQSALWFNNMERAAPADLGGLRYGLIGSAFIFGLLVGALLLSIAVIGVTIGFEWLFSKLGMPLRRPASKPAVAPTDEPAPGPVAPDPASSTEPTLLESARQ